MTFAANTARLLLLVGSCAAPLLTAEVGAQDMRDASGAEQKIYAQRHFEEGLAHYDGKRFAEALVAFRASLDLYASPNTRLYLARTLAELEAYSKAANTYEETIRAAELLVEQEARYAETAKAARDELNSLRNRLARVRLLLAPGTRVRDVKVNGEPLRLEMLGLPIYVAPGSLEVHVTYENGSRREFQHEAKAQRFAEVKVPAQHGAPRASDVDRPPGTDRVAMPLDEVEIPSDHSGYEIGLALSAGITVVGVASAIGFGLAAENKFDALRDECGGPCPSDRSEDINAGKTYDTLTNIGIVAGSVGLASTALFVVFLLHADDAEVAETHFAVVPGGVEARW